MDLESSWQRAVDLLHDSSDVWASPEFEAAFPHGLEYVASAIVHTVGTEEIDWIETVTDLESPKAQVAAFVDDLLVHAVLTAHGFGFEVRKLRVNMLRATATPRVHDEQGAFAFIASLDGLDMQFPWDADNHKQDGRMHEHFQRMLKALRAG